MLRALLVLLLVAGTACADPWWKESSPRPPPHADQHHPAESEGHSDYFEAVLSQLSSFGNWFLDWDHDDWIAFGTIVIGVFTAVLGGGTIFLVIDGRRHSEWQLRAYIFSKPTLTANLDGAAPPSYSVVFRNSGQTPALKVVSWTRAGVRVYPLTEDLPVPKKLTNLSSGSLNPAPDDYHRLSETFPASLTAPQIAGIRAGSLRIFVWGMATYVDVFGKERHTPFRYMYGGAEIIALGGMAMCEEGNDPD